MFLNVYIWHTHPTTLKNQTWLFWDLEKFFLSKFEVVVVVVVVVVGGGVLVPDPPTTTP